MVEGENLMKFRLAIQLKFLEFVETLLMFKYKR